MGEFLEYGNVIKIISSDSVYDNKYFFVERLYDNKLVLISDKETITLGITDQILDDTSISENIKTKGKIFNFLYHYVGSYANLEHVFKNFKDLPEFNKLMLWLRNNEDYVNPKYKNQSPWIDLVENKI